MSFNFMRSGEDCLRFLPEIIMTAIGTLIMLLEPLTSERKKSYFGYLSLAAFVAALAAAVAANNLPGKAFSDMLIIYGFATVFRVRVIGLGILAVLCCSQYLKRQHARPREYYALPLFALNSQGVVCP